MDTANLSAFLAVAEHASFSRAAEQLHLTQPAISKRIATLEQQLGARLFDRIGRHISMTEAGRALKPRRTDHHRPERHQARAWQPVQPGPGAPEHGHQSSHWPSSPPSGPA